MSDESILAMTFEEYYLFQLPTAQEHAPSQPDAFYRRQALRNYENLQNIKRDQAERERRTS